MRRAKEDQAREALRQDLRAAGLKATSARVAVLDSLKRAAAPVSHGDLAAALEREGLDRATVYRNLTDLTEAGLARRSDLGDHVWRFEAVGKGAPHVTSELHPHFMCSTCGDVQCLPDAAVQIKSGRGVPGSLRRKAVEIQVRGLCDRCV